MLNVAHVKNDVKYPIVTKFGTLIENMSRTGLYDFMRISNFGMGVLHVKVKYWRIFCDVISLLAPVFILSSNRVSKEVSMKKNVYGSVFVIWLYFQKARYRPCELDLWPMKVNLF